MQLYLELAVRMVTCVCMCVVGKEKQEFAVSRHGKSLAKFSTLHHVNENYAIITKWIRCVLQ